MVHKSRYNSKHTTLTNFTETEIDPEYLDFLSLCMLYIYC